MDPHWFEGFASRRVQVGGIAVHTRIGGRDDAPPLVLLHGFPQTGAMWHRVARQLADAYRIVIPDLRGYGDSEKLPGTADHAQASKRAMAADVAGLMRLLGHERFFVCGHDRGGRVAHRLALDHPDAVRRLCVLDIAPTLDMYAATDFEFARPYYHWFHLIAPAPLPEKMLGGDPRFYLRAKLAGWGSGEANFVEPEAMAEYERCFCRAETIHAVCEDYRASASIDLEHDRASRAAGEQVACDILALWGERGVVHRLFDPVALWQAQCRGSVTGRPVPCGHYIPEQLPELTADALRAFMG